MTRTRMRCWREKSVPRTEFNICWPMQSGSQVQLEVDWHQLDNTALDTTRNNLIERLQAER